MKPTRSLALHASSAALGALGAALVLGLTSMQFSPLPAGPALPAYATPTLTAEQAQILAHMSLVDLPDGAGGLCKTLRITGLNVQIVNGLGSTETTNCRGNLIVGYGETLGTTVRTGSHNILVGKFNSYTSFGGLVAGAENHVDGPYATVLGGNQNVAAGNHAAVLGGTNNQVYADIATISGGRSNLIPAGNGSCSITGGMLNVASGAFTTVVGGYDNQTAGLWTTICGGRENDASGSYSSVSGGRANAATHDDATVSGGCSTTTSVACDHVP